jgi:hypothetical protein
MGIESSIVQLIFNNASTLIGGRGAVPVSSKHISTKQN